MEVSPQRSRIMRTAELWTSLQRADTQAVEPVSPIPAVAGHMTAAEIPFAGETHFIQQLRQQLSKEAVTLSPQTWQLVRQMGAEHATTPTFVRAVVTALKKEIPLTAMTVHAIMRVLSEHSIGKHLVDLHQAMTGAMQTTTRAPPPLFEALYRRILSVLSLDTSTLHAPERRVPVSLYAAQGMVSWAQQLGLDLEHRLLQHAKGIPFSTGDPAMSAENISPQHTIKALLSALVSSPDTEVALLGVARETLEHVRGQQLMLLPDRSPMYAGSWFIPMGASSVLTMTVQTQRHDTHSVVKDEQEARIAFEVALPLLGETTIVAHIVARHVYVRIWNDQTHGSEFWAAEQVRLATVFAQQGYRLLSVSVAPRAEKPAEKTVFLKGVDMRI